jgi:hypothetical protein
MNIQKFIYQLRTLGEHVYVARLNISDNSPLQLKKIDENEWNTVSPWEELPSKTVPSSEWLGHNEMKNLLYKNGIDNSII